MQNLEKIGADLQVLLTLFKTSAEKNPLHGNDPELKRLWAAYGKLRADLAATDEEWFGDLRELEIPEPAERDNEYHASTGGLYFASHLEPLQNELVRAATLFQTYLRRTNEDAPEPTKVLKFLAKRFHRVCRHLRERHSDRGTISVEDEYDVQDLFRSLLSIYFEDIRKEEWTPSYAGSSSRMDFLLKTEQVVVETKKTRSSLTEKRIGEELIVDIVKYCMHPDCKVLFCFVYDPEARIANPSGLENDLSKLHNGLQVIVVVEPKT